MQLSTSATTVSSSGRLGSSASSQPIGATSLDDCEEEEEEEEEEAETRNSRRGERRERGTSDSLCQDEGAPSRASQASLLPGVDGVEEEGTVDGQSQAEAEPGGEMRSASAGAAHEGSDKESLVPAARTATSEDGGRKHGGCAVGCEMQNGEVSGKVDVEQQPG
eukprot:756166-Hanusia_phi.AAC.2